MKIKIRRDVDVELSPEEWQLFTDMPGAMEAARQLNIAASEALSLSTREAAKEHFNVARDEWAEYGAADTEPRWVFEDLCDEVFGMEMFIGNQIRRVI